ncbi:MAG: glycosyltransferase, partial [Candidatus Latescibacteria bacterium]|nr:glycosyltransferase [Candidatus Latescibacterota bacterium]
MSNVPPLLSVVMVVGSARSQAQSVVDALYAQTRPDDMEIVIVDIAAVGTLPLRTEPTVYTKYILQPGVEFWGKARTEGVQHASAAVVAFLEDHCWPEPDWADALIEAHQQPWASVGYAVKNGSPDTYLYRAALLADYGLWAHPARGGPTKLLP